MHVYLYKKKSKSQRKSVMYQQMYPTLFCLLERKCILKSNSYLMTGGGESAAWQQCSYLEGHNRKLRVLPQSASHANKLPGWVAD